MGVGFFAAVFPDIDGALALLSPTAYLLGHRGLTHSLLLLPVWAALLAWLFSSFGRRRECLKPFFVISAAALAVHVAGDVITSFGTLLLSPLSDRRFALSSVFIIDLWFSGIALAGVVGSLLLPRWRLPAVAALAALCGYVAFSSLPSRTASATRSRRSTCAARNRWWLARTPGSCAGSTRPTARSNWPHG